MNDKISTLASLRDEFDRWRAYLSGLTEAQITAPNPANGLSIQDIVGHLHAWQQVSNARLEAAQQSGEPVYPDWCAGQFPDDEEYIEQFNATIHATYRLLPWPAVYVAWRDGFLRLLALAETFTTSDLTNANQYPWLNGYALADVLSGTLEHHAEHQVDVGLE